MTKVTCYLLLLCASCALINSVFATDCSYEIVETMPENLLYMKPLSFEPTPTHEALIKMVEDATESVKIASFYITLRSEPEFASHPSAEAGLKLLNSIVAAAERGVNVEIILDNSMNRPMTNQEDVNRLEAAGAKIKYLNMTKLLKNGVMHTKFMTTDDRALYLGSSNFDWRSYSQIKEMGIKFNDCPVLASDLNKVFNIYSFVSQLEKGPKELPEEFNTQINMQHPYEILMGDSRADVFLASSPPDFNGETKWTGRTDDLDAVLGVINSAQSRIDISVMNYGPRTAFIWPKEYWPAIDDALRRAATVRRVSVRLLFSDWDHKKPEEMMWYKSLDALQSPEALRGGAGIKVKLFKVPAFDEFQATIPYSRVKHDKYMVTDNSVFIGTSNWTPDYFINTCGLSYTIRWKSLGNHESNNPKLVIVDQMQEIFERDFNSEYAHDLE